MPEGHLEQDTIVIHQDQDIKLDIGRVENGKIERTIIIKKYGIC